MNEEKPEQQPPVSHEFYVRVNDFIEMANRIERRHDRRHAQVAMLHAFSRYSSHLYRTATVADDAATREAFTNSIAAELKEVMALHLADILGPAPVPEPGAAAADADAAE